MTIIRKTFVLVLALALVLSMTIVPGMTTASALTDMDEATYENIYTIGENVYDFTDAAKGNAFASSLSSGKYVITGNCSGQLNTSKEAVILVPKDVSVTFTGGTASPSANLTYILDGGEIQLTSSTVNNGTLTILCTEKGGFIHTGTKTFYSNAGAPTINLGCEGMAGELMLYCVNTVQNSFFRICQTGTTINVYDGVVFKANNKDTTTKNLGPAAVMAVTTNNATVNIYGGKFIGNHTASGTDSGIVTVTGSNNAVNIYDGEFINNTSDGNRGLFYLNNASSSINVFGGKFSGNSNKSTSSGSVFTVANGTLNLYIGEMTDNYNSGAAGAIVGNYNISSNFVAKDNYSGATISSSTTTETINGKAATVYTADCSDGTADTYNNANIYSYCFEDENGKLMKEFRGAAVAGNAFENVPNDLIIQGKIFEGWTLNGDTSKIYSCSQIKETVIAENTSYKFAPSFIEYAGQLINFDTNGGEFPENSVKYQIVDTGTVLEQKDFTVSTPAKESYVFKGWALNADDSEPVSSVTVNDPLVLHAIWAIDETPTDVTIYNNDGSVLDTLSVKADGSLKVAEVTSNIVAEDKTNQDFVFKGWAYDAEGNQLVDQNTIYLNNVTKLYAVFFGRITLTASAGTNENMYFFTENGVFHEKSWVVNAGCPIGENVANEIMSILPLVSYSSDGIKPTINPSTLYYTIAVKSLRKFYITATNSEASISDTPALDSKYELDTTFTIGTTGASKVVADLSDAPDGASLNAKTTYEKFFNSDQNTSAFYYGDEVFSNANYRTSQNEIIFDAPEGYYASGAFFSNTSGYYLSDDTSKISSTDNYYVYENGEYVAATDEQKTLANKANLYEYADVAYTAFPTYERGFVYNYVDKTKSEYINGSRYYRTYSLKPEWIKGYEINVPSRMIKTGSTQGAALTGNNNTLFDGNTGSSNNSSATYTLVSLDEAVKISGMSFAIGASGKTATSDGTARVYLFKDNPYDAKTGVDTSLAVAAYEITKGDRVITDNMYQSFAVDMSNCEEKVSYVYITDANYNVAGNLVLSEATILNANKPTPFFDVTIKNNTNSSTFVLGTTASTSEVTIKDSLFKTVMENTVLTLPTSVSDWDEDGVGDVSGTSANNVLIGYVVLENGETFNGLLSNNLDTSRLVKEVKVTSNITVVPIAAPKTSGVLGTQMRTSGVQGLRFVVSDNAYSSFYGYSNVSYSFYMMKYTDYEQLESKTVEAIENSSALYSEATAEIKGIKVAKGKTMTNVYGAVLTGFDDTFDRYNSEIVCIPIVKYIKNDVETTQLLSNVGNTNHNSVFGVASAICAKYESQDLSKGIFSAYVMKKYSYETGTEENDKYCYLSWVLANA